MTGEREGPERPVEDARLEELRSDLHALQERLRAATRERWDRDLPLGELLSDRWERARSLGFGEGTSIYASSYVYGSVEVGEHTWIGPFTLLDGSGGLRIGDYCSISAGVHIYSHDTVKWAVSLGKAEYERAPVRIGHGCHIGARSVVAKGVTIGDQCVVGAASFVNRDLPPRSVAFGTPCRRVGEVVVGDDGGVELIVDR